MADNYLIQEGKGGENAGHRKERENPARQPSAKSGSVLLSTVPPAQQLVMTTVATKKMSFALLSPLADCKQDGHVTRVQKLLLAAPAVQGPSDRHR